jgi:hypothetical protein
VIGRPVTGEVDAGGVVGVVVGDELVDAATVEDVDVGRIDVVVEFDGGAVTEVVGPDELVVVVLDDGPPVVVVTTTVVVVAAEQSAGNSTDAVAVSPLRV